MLSYRFFADAVLVVHLGVIVFVIGGLLLILAGNALRWRWVNGLWYRLVHLLAIAFVAIQAWLGANCPLTTLESWLRVRAGSAGYGKSFIEHWVQWLVYYEAPPWVFALAYTLFALLVLACWWRFPPRRS